MGQISMEITRLPGSLLSGNQHLAEVESEADSLGLRSKRLRFRSGREQGGNKLSRGQIHHILTNPVYLGRIRHKDKDWPGLHPAIIDEDQWSRVQVRLQAAAVKPRGRRQATGAGVPEPAPLKGKLRDEAGDRLTPTHTLRHGRRIGYYISNRLLQGGPDATGWRLPAARLEPAISHGIADHLDRLASEQRLLTELELRVWPEHAARVQDLCAKLRSGDALILATLLKAGRIGTGQLHLDLDEAKLAEGFGIGRDALAPDATALVLPFLLRRRGVELRVLAGARKPSPDPVLLKALADAHRWAKAMRTGAPLQTIARDAGHHDALVRTRMPLAFLSPRIQRAILDGTQPLDLTLERLVRHSLPLDWDAQERFCGF